MLNGGTTAIPVNGSTNRLANAVYDANGNMTSGAGVMPGYDVGNRMTSAQLVSGGTEYYGYSPDNKRIYRNTPRGTYRVKEWTLYGAYGERLGVFYLGGSPFEAWFSVVRTSVWFAGRLITEDATNPFASSVSAVMRDRLGSNRAGGARFYPYGEEIGTATANDRTKFATYTRDGVTGLDYADQRFYASGYGRFNTPDPARSSAGPSDPSSWNRYAYVGGDPVNSFDSTGLFTEGSGGDDGCYYNGQWVPGCDIGGPTRFSPVTAFSRGRQRLWDAQNALSDRTSFSLQCVKDISAIAGQRSPDMRGGLDAFSVIDAAVSANLKNGVGSADPISSLYADPFAASSAQAAADKKYGPGQTVGGKFAQNPNGLTAASALGGNTIYINGSLIGGNLQSNEALLFHEAFHLLGFDDADLQVALGITVDPNNTRNITDKLKKDCITGKGNN